MPNDQIHPPGSFEYIEAKIRNDAEGTEFGGDFEWLCIASISSAEAASIGRADLRHFHWSLGFHSSDN
jgi:hypothetical protein